MKRKMRMPRYNYKCGYCNIEFSQDLAVADRTLPIDRPCPSCGEYMVRKTVGCGGFQLKGFCWSKDGYSRTLGDDPNYKKGNF